MIVEKHFEDAHDFLSELSALHREGDHVFRGHSHADWKLLPTAWRNTQGRSEVDQTLHEMQELHRFVKMLLQAGLAPAKDIDELYSLKGFLEHMASRDFLRCVPFAFEQFRRAPISREASITHNLALAQHHGVRTRLLDFSANPFKALWFAAVGVLRAPLDVAEHNLSVWCLWIKPSPQFLSSYYHEKELGLWLERITAPTWNNANLRAQEGLFVRYYDEAWKGQGEFHPGGLEDFLHALDNPRFTGLAPRKFTISSRHVVDLLVALENMGIQAASMFPGYQGVADTIADRALLLAREAHDRGGEKRVRKSVARFRL